jgi:hypothetical protein
MLTLHIGLPKTGTTFLQYQIFKRQGKLPYIHDPLDTSQDAIEHQLKLYFRCRSTTLDRLDESVPRVLPRGEVLVSNENISMKASEVWQAGGPTPSSFAERLRRLSSTVGGVRVLLGIRRQDQWLGSRYAESAKNFPEFGQGDFETRMAEISESPLQGALQWLEYAAAYERLAEAIGQDNVMVIPSEELLTDPESILHGLEEFLGHRGLVEAYRTAKAATGLRRNVLSTGRNTWQLRTRDAHITLPDGLESRLLTRFRDENRALDKVLDGTLSAHSYH